MNGKNRKATVRLETTILCSRPNSRITLLSKQIVIEHLIQASDVVHTMQHWHIYRKWNKRLFNEMLDAFRSGRSCRDPVPGWYEGELAFFDKYVIPLAQKLKDCCVFGVSSEEYVVVVSPQHVSHS